MSGKTPPNEEDDGSRDIPDYLIGRKLIEFLSEMERETARRRSGGDDAIADTIAEAHAYLHALYLADSDQSMRTRAVGYRHWLETNIARLRGQHEEGRASALALAGNRLTELIPGIGASTSQPAATDVDIALADIQQAYDELRSETGRAPSQRRVADITGYARETVRARWSKVRK